LIRASWIQAHHTCVKWNLNGYVKFEDVSTCVGMVLRDKSGDIIFSACCQLLNCSYPFKDEAMASEQGLRFMGQWSDTYIELKLECKLLIDAIQEKSPDQSHLSHLILFTIGL
jgi:hypothetical protein